MGVWFLLACTSESAPDAPVGTYDHEAATAIARPDPSMDAPALQTTLDDFLALGLPDPVSLKDVFFGLLVGGDSNCPTGAGASITSFSGCTSSKGWTYTGSSVYDEDQGGFRLSADIYVSDPSGRTFGGGGQLGYLFRQDGIGGTLDGTWGYEDADGWMGKFPSFNYSVYYRQSTGAGSINGGLSMEGVSVEFEELQLSKSCAAPVGTIHVRDPQGWWYELVLPTDCSGCGPLQWGEEELGTVCVKVDAFMDLIDRLQQ